MTAPVTTPVQAEMPGSILEAMFDTVGEAIARKEHQRELTEVGTDIEHRHDLVTGLGQRVKTIVLSDKYLARTHSIGYVAGGICLPCSSCDSVQMDEDTARGFLVCKDCGNSDREQVIVDMASHTVPSLKDGDCPGMSAGDSVRAGKWQGKNAGMCRRFEGERDVRYSRFKEIEANSKLFFPHGEAKGVAIQRAVELFESATHNRVTRASPRIALILVCLAYAENPAGADIDTARLVRLAPSQVTVEHIKEAQKRLDRALSVNRHGSAGQSDETDSGCMVIGSSVRNTAVTWSQKEELSFSPTMQAYVEEVADSMARDRTAKNRYKTAPSVAAAAVLLAAQSVGLCRSKKWNLQPSTAVSYTHLTLPTILLV